MSAISTGSAAYLEHVAIFVRDVHWHMNFFRDVLRMAVRDVDGDAASPKQVWVFGGIQFIADPDFSAPEGRLAHLGVMVADMEAALAAAYAVPGVTAHEKGRNWLLLPDGLLVELLQASPPAAVAQALAVNARM
ncbi:MAG: VOC family protein [Beijerinckiaceae bacterium]